MTSLRKAGVMVLWAALSTGGLQAALWDTGLFNGGGAAGGISNACDAGPNVCGNSASQYLAVFDNFHVSNPGWVISGFDLVDYFFTTDPSVVTGQYKSTSWSIWSGNPLSGGSLLSSGTALYHSGSDLTVGACSAFNGTCVTTIKVTGLNVTLGAGDYYIGTTNNASGLVTERALSAGGPDAGTLPGWEQARNTGAAWSSFSNSSVSSSNDTAFDIQGTLVPEPSTWALMSLALAGFAALRRRKA